MPKQRGETQDKMSRIHSRRYFQWFSEGKKDGMCGILHSVWSLPRSSMIREAYNNGHTYGMLLREGLSNGKINRS